MFKNIIVLILFIFMVKAQAQVQKTPLIGAEVNSDGVVEIANLKCMGETCIPEGRTFLLPFTVAIEGGMNGVNIANAEVYLTTVMKSEFNEKLRVLDYKGGIKLFGAQIEALGINNNSTNLLSINVVRTEFVEQLDLSEDGKTRLKFMLYGTLGVAKLTNKFDEFSQGGMDLIEEDFGTTPEEELMNNNFGSVVDMGASVTFQMNKFSVTGYTRFMTHTSNNLFGGNADANGLVNQTRYNTFQLGLDLYYNVYNGKNGSSLYLFSNVQYGSYSHSLISGQNGLDIHSMPPATKELNFTAGLRYTLPTFSGKKKGNTKRKIRKHRY